MAKSYIAEGIGTFGLTLAVGLSLAGVFPVATPVIAALTLGLFVYTVGHISGAHLNPAITIGVWSLKKIRASDAIGYIVAQFIGAGIAFGIMRVLHFVPVLLVRNTVTTGLFEMLGAFFFGLGVASVLFGKTPSVLNGVVIGGSLLLGISIAAVASNGVLNPAVAFGINSFSLSYGLGPILGALLGMWIYRWLIGEM